MTHSKRRHPWVEKPLRQNNSPTNTAITRPTPTAPPLVVISDGGGGEGRSLAALGRSNGPLFLTILALAVALGQPIH